MSDSMAIVQFNCSDDLDHARRTCLREGELCGVKAILDVLADTQDALCNWLPN